MRQALVTPLFVLAILLGGCGGSMQSANTLNTSGPTANAAGSWAGFAGVGAVSAPVTLQLAQTGSNVKGNITVGGRPDFSGPVTGTVQGNGLSLRLASGTASLPMLTVASDQITGDVGPGPMILRRSK
jgi:hypothetical protein